MLLRFPLEHSGSLMLKNSALTILAIDPGPVESGFVFMGAKTYQVLDKGKLNNEAVRRLVMSGAYDLLAIEKIASYGMSVGQEVFDTCIWIGRFLERGLIHRDVELFYRRDIKLHFCESARAKDANITQALIDRFAPGVPNRGKGSKDHPGWFYGFRADIWQAYALAVYTADTLED